MSTRDAKNAIHALAEGAAYIHVNTMDKRSEDALTDIRRVVEETGLSPRELRNSRDAILTALEDCATRFERCCVHSGSDKEFAAAAVADYRALLKAAKVQP